MADQQVKEAKESRVKRDFLRKIELEAQKKWEEEKTFQYDAPTNDGSQRPKYVSTFPYPYMNGRLHLGHTFTVTKAEFAASYQRLKGKNSLFPFAFHCTGMPIKAVADKLKREIETYGVPPRFPEEIKEVEEEATSQESKADPLAFHAKKSKAQAKTGGMKYQWQILRSLGIPDEEIPRFSDAAYWLKYFPPYCQQDLTKMGTSIDWRRSFITTDTNPYYDSFVRWQFETLNDLGKIKYGKRYTIFSPKDGQPCMDHDRQSGEGVMPQEYVLIKQEVVEPFPEKLAPLAGKKVFLVPGTLRPETMYGQTNVWILPEGDYGAFEVNDKEVFICTERAARNMAFQFLSREEGKVSCLLKLKGWDLLGVAVKAPLSYYPVIYVLPMSTISMTKGTGVVTSVPSDSPDDFICFDELKRKPQWRQKFGIKDEMVEPYEVIEIINIPELGNKAAELACQQFKVKSIKDRESLTKAKDLVYQKGFYEGKMLVGEHKGALVKDAKPKIKELLIANGQAVIYSEPTDLVMSRSGDVCVVALVNQWYLTYGEDEWRSQVRKHLDSMDFYSDESRTKFENALDWLHQWACSRTYGLGTRLPWDPQYLIDSLSDSTIYMSFYTIAHLLQADVNGSKPGPAGISPEKMNRKVWNYIFLKGEYPSDCGIPEDTLKKLRTEFEYWYPVDLRVSGKDLVTNHLIFFMYNHCAIWKDNHYWPKAIRANGHVLLNGEKMSKSTGNFLTLSDSIDEYSADGTRFALADAGDSLDDANFATKTADTAILRLYTQIQWIEEMLAEKGLRDPSNKKFADSVFESEINKAIIETDKHYERTNFREALQSGFYGLQAVRDNYRLIVGGDKEMRKDLVMRFIEVQAILLAPICPHWSEYVWKLIGKTGSVRTTDWPVAGQIDLLAIQMKDYLFDTAHEFRIKKDYFMKPKKNEKQGKVPTKATIMVAETYPDWQQKVLETIKPFFHSAGTKESQTIDEKGLIAAVQGDPELKKLSKKVMPFVIVVKEQFKIRGMAALNLKMPFDEKAFVQENLAFIQQSLGLQDIEVTVPNEENKERVKPGEPAILFS